nr:hypothetical protein [Tanacetum cinerariifolium]
MESLSPQVVFATKLPILNPNEFNIWKMRIEQFFLMTDYSLWEVILNGDSPIPIRVIDGVLQLVAPTTAEQRLARKNELKARGTLLMALPDKHKLKFNSYKDVKTLIEAIEKSSESLHQIDDRLQKLISQLENFRVSLSQEDINLKFLRSIPSKWRTHTLIWRNKTDLEEQSLDDLFNSLKIYEAECVGNKKHKAFPLPVIKFPLAEEVPTASEESSHCQKKRDATAMRIALLIQFHRVFVVSQGESLSIHITFTFNSQQEMDQQNPTLAKIPILDIGKFEQWQYRIQQYLQHEHYALWEVIKFGDSYEVPASTASTTTTDITSGETGKKSGRTVTLTAEDMQKRKNDVKERTTLLLSLPNEHQLRFSEYKTAQKLWAAILKTFGAKHSWGNEDGNSASVSTASTNVPTASANIGIDEDDMEEMDIKWSMALLSMRANKFWKKTGKKISIQGSDVAGFDKSKVECFNYHKMGHFARECRAPKSQDRGRRDKYRQGSKVKEQASKALMAIDGVGWDWSYMANDKEDHALVADEEAPTEFALMANTSPESKVFDNSLCSKDCKKNNNSLKSKIIDLTDKFFDAKSMIYHYKLGLAQVESRLVEHKDREIKYCEKIRGLEFRTKSNNDFIEILKKELKTLKQEKEWVDSKLAGFLTASKDLDNLIESQRLDKNKEGLGYSVVPPPPAQIYSSPKKNLSWTGLPEFADDTVTDYSRLSPTIESTSGDDQNKNSFVPETDASPSTITSKPFIKFVKPNDSPSKSKTGRTETPKKPPVKNFPPVSRKFSTVSRNFPTVNRKFLTANRKFSTGGTKFSTADMGKKGKAVKPSGCWFWKPSQNFSNKGPNNNSVSGSSQNNIDDKGYWDSGCSRHMTSNISYLSDYEPFDGGYVSFGQGGCKITGKGIIKIGRDFKLLDDANILVRTPRQHNMYAIDLNNFIPHKDLTRLVSKASTDECMLWHRRLGKFEEKGDEGYFIGYSMSSKVFRVFNKRTRRVEENLHVQFLENKAIEKGTKDATSQEVKKNVSSLRYIALPNWAHDALLESSLSKPQDHCSTEVPKSSRNLNPTASTLNPPADQMETLTVESLIPTVSSPVPTAYSTDSQEPSNESNGVEADVSNMETTITASPTPTLRIHKDHPKSHIIGPVDTPIQTRNKSKEVEAMQEELLQFKIQNVWTLVDCPKGVRPIGTKWVLKNKKDERGIVIRNKARLVAQGHTQEEGIDYDEVFAHVARIKAIKLFLAYASFMGFTVYQMDVKSAFLYGTIDEEVYVMQPLGFQDPEFPAKVYKVEKAMYGLHQAPRAWYVLQKEDDIFLSQDKYVGDILKKFGYSDVRSSNTPMDKENPWGKDEPGKDVDLHLYRSMIGSLMYLIASRPDIMFAICACARHQVTPKECHLHVVKRIFRYLNGHPKLGLWYPKESLFDLVAYSYSNYGGATQDRKSTTGGCQFLGRRLISWQCKKQTIVATSTTEAEYVTAASCYGQVL